VDDESFEVKDLTWEGKTYKGVFIREDFQGKISVHGADGEIVFGADARLYWSEIASSPLYLPDIIEPVYDAASLRLSLCSDGDSAGITVKENEVEYRSKGETAWSPTPSYGEILARVKDRGGVFVTPVKFLNVGELSVTPLKADKDSCSIKVSWPHGRSQEKQRRLGNRKEFLLRPSENPFPACSYWPFPCPVHAHLASSFQGLLHP